MRKSLAEFFGMVAFLSFLILGLCIVFLPYVGVYITYVCLPVGGVSTILWWFFNKISGESED